LREETLHHRSRRHKRRQSHWLVRTKQLATASAAICCPIFHALTLQTRSNHVSAARRRGPSFLK
jgi:hypothetical protein